MFRARHKSRTRRRDAELLLLLPCGCVEGVVLLRTGIVRDVALLAATATVTQAAANVQLRPCGERPAEPVQPAARPGLPGRLTKPDLGTKNSFHGSIHYVKIIFVSCKYQFNTFSYSQHNI